MKENITFIMVEQGLQLHFNTIDDRNKFIENMKEHEMSFFNEGLGAACDVSTYSDEQPYGAFISKEGRIGLNFPSEKQKFFFKERVGLASDCFMDMGPGYNEQVHFNEEIFPCRLGATLITTRDVEESDLSSFSFK